MLYRVEVEVPEFLVFFCPDENRAPRRIRDCSSPPADSLDVSGERLFSSYYDDSFFPKANLRS